MKWESDMPDIAMCNNKDCKLKETCYRYTAKPSEYMQSYVHKEGELEECDMYWKCQPLNKNIKLMSIIGRAVELLQADNKDLASWHIAKDELIKEIEG